MVLGCKDCGRRIGKNHNVTCSQLKIRHNYDWSSGTFDRYWRAVKGEHGEVRWYEDDLDPTVTYTRPDGRTLTLSARTKKELVMNLKTLATIS